MQIEITLKNYRCFSDEEPATILLGEGFTALVGVNNAGKSSILKFFFEFRDLFNRLKDLEELRGYLNNKVQFGLQSVLDQREVFCNLNERNIVIDVRLTDLPEAPDERPVATRATISIGGPMQAHLELYDAKGYKWVSNQWMLTTYVSNAPLDTGSSNVAVITLNDGSSNTRVNTEAIQFAFEKLANTLYIGPFRNVINSGGSPNYFDLAIGMQFVTQWRRWRTGNNKAQTMKINRLTKDIGLIFGLTDLNIAASDDDTTLHIEMDGQSYKLNELGTGLAQFILVLATAAMRSQAYILIDEPELNLHPSLQLDFLTTLGSYATDGVLFSTHSIGLARSAGNWIYSIQRRDGRSIIRKYDETPNLSEFLGELNFSAYRDLGFRKVLLVEGQTEVKLMQQFLRCYGKDHRIVLLPMNGSSFINGQAANLLDEVLRITTDLHAVIDSERSSEGAPLEPSRQDFVNVCNTLGIQCKVLDWRASENYLTTEAAQKAFGEKYRGLTPFEERKSAPVMWKKNENWKVARYMSREDLAKTDLGTFLAGL